MNNFLGIMSRIVTIQDGESSHHDSNCEICQLKHGGNWNLQESFIASRPKGLRCSNHKGESQSDAILRL